MSSKDTGGPAFPTIDANREADYGTYGMTMRDYFAAKAMQGELAAMSGFEDDSSGLETDIEDDSLLRLAKHWFRIADAMLEARK